MAPVARSSAASAAVKAGGGDRGRHMEWAGVLHKHVKVKKDTGRRAQLCDSIFHVSYDHLKNTRNPYNMLAGVIKYKVVTTGWFETLIQLTIMLVAVTTGMSLEVKDDDQDQLDLLDSLNMVTLTIFTAEVVLKLLAEGTHLWQYFTNEDRLWNVFDFSIVATSLALLGSDGGATVSVLRLLRVLRLLKFVKGIRNLYIIMIGLIAGLKSVVYIMALLLLVIYLFAVAGVLMFRENDPAHFQSTSIALLTLFRCATLAAWPEPFYVNFFGCDVYNAEIYTNGDTLEYFETQLGSFPEFTCHSPVVSKLPSLVYFFIYVILTAFVILSLFIGVITMGMFEAMNEAAKENKSEIEKARDRNAKRSEAVRANEARGALAELDKLAHIALQDLEDDYPLTDLALRVPAIAVYQNLSKKAWDIMTNPSFNNAITMAILVAGIMVGMSTDGNMFVSPWFTNFANKMIMVMFTAEVVVKLVAEGLEPLNYFYDPWNIFDFIIVFLGLLDYIITVGDVAIMRLLRLLRVFKLARSLPKLRSIVEAMLEGFASVSWAVILMLVSNYIFAILGVLLFRSSDPMYFGSLRNAMISIFMVVTLDNWEEMMYTNMYGCEKYGYTDLRAFPVVAYDCPSTTSADGKTRGMGWVSAIYFVILVIYGGLVIPTVLIGVVAVAFEKSTKRINVERADEMQVTAICNFARPNFPSFLTGRRVGYIFSVFKQLADVDEKQHQIFQENKQKGDPVIVSFFGMRLFLISIAEEYFNRKPLDNKQDAEEFDEWMVKLFHISDPAHDFCNFPQFLLVLLALRDSRQEERPKHGMDDAIVVQGDESGGNWRGNWLSDFLVNIESVQEAKKRAEDGGLDDADGDREEDTVTLVMEKGDDKKEAIKSSKDNFLERKRRGSGNKSNGAAGGSEPGAWLNNNGSGPSNTGSYQREGLPRSGSRAWPNSRPSYGGDEQHAQQYASQQMQATVRQSRPAYPVTQAQLLNGDRIDDESLARVQDENEAMRTRIEQLESAIFSSKVKGSGGDQANGSNSKRAASAAPRVRAAGGRGGSGLRKSNSSSGSPGPPGRKGGGNGNSDDDSGHAGNL